MRTWISRRLAGMVLALVAVLALPGCWPFGTDQIKIGAGRGLYAHIQRRPTNQIEQLHYILHGGDARRTLKALRDEVYFGDDVRGRVLYFGYRISDLDYFFAEVQKYDFDEAVANVRGRDRCLLLHRNPANLFGDRHNWTWSVDPPYCGLGHYYQSV